MFSCSKQNFDRPVYYLDIIHRPKSDLDALVNIKILQFPINDNSTRPRDFSASSHRLQEFIASIKEHAHVLVLIIKLLYLIHVNTKPLQILSIFLKKKLRLLYSFSMLKVALGVCFALKSWKEYLLLFTYLITLGKDVTLLLITKFKTNRPLSNLFVNRIPN